MPASVGAVDAKGDEMTAVVAILVSLAVIFGCVGLVDPLTARWAFTVAFVLFAAGVVAPFIEGDGSQQD